MKAKISLFLFALLMFSSMAFAVNGSAYYVLRSSGFNSYTLSQETYGCSPSYGYGGFGYGNNCIASVKDTPANLAKLLKDNWKESTGFWNSTLVLGSDIDLGEFGASTKVGTCDVNHVPLFHPYMGSIDGKGYTIRNLCFSGMADAPMGLFSEFQRGDVTNLKISGVRIYISGSSTKGADYYPVGAFAGVIDSSHVSNVTLANDSIDAPFAGGLVGLASNCTIENVSGDDDIRITNTTTIKDGYAGSTLLGDSYGFNAYLGGIAGVTIRDNKDVANTYYRDSIKVDVLDLAAGHKSAVGGISGVLASSGASVANVTVFTKKKINGEVLKSHIAGGSAMGGLFGFLSVHYKNKSAEEGTISLSKSKFEGEIRDGSTAVSGTNGDTVGFVSMGGLIGRDSILSLSALKIDTSSAIVDIADSVKVSGNFRYMVGGLLGSTSKCNNTQNDTSYVFVKGSKASGNIDLAGSGVAVNKLHMQTFVGGIAGYVCLASGTNGMRNDTSSVAMNVRTKTGTGLVSNGAAVFDTIGVGGLVGYVNNHSEKTLKFYKDVFDGSIVIQDSLNTVSAGGVVGAYPEANGGKSIAFESVVVKSENVIEVTSAEAAAVTKGYNDKQINRLGGLCGYCRAVSNITQTGVSGNILQKGFFAGDSVLIGGLLGNIYTAETMNTVIQSSFMNGDILVANVDESKVMAGYIWGSGIVFGHTDIKSNYHYSEVDEVEPFGVFYTGKDITNIWKTDKDKQDLDVVNVNIDYVIRNSETKRDFAPKEHNGFKTSEYMKKAAFAGFLNEDLDPYGWSYEKGSNNDLPFPVDASHVAIAPGSVVTYTVNFMDYDGKLLSTQIVREGYPATAPDEPEREGHDFIGWDKAFDDIEMNLTVNAQYKAHRYYVIFHKENGDTLSGFFTPANAVDEGNFVEYGTAVDAPGSQYATLLAKEGYVFVGWDDSTYSYVTKNMDIYPVYKLNEFSVSYVNEKEELVFEKKFPYGEELVINESAVKAANDSVTYVFEKWTLENGDDLPATMPNSNLTIVPVFKEIRNSYTVVFVDFDGKQIGEEQVVEYGSAAEAPEKPVSAGRVFKGWSDLSFVNVVADVKVVALYDTAKFTVVLLDHEGNEYKTIPDVFYNKDLSSEKGPARTATKEYVYTFKGWEPELARVTSDMTVKALYDSAKVEYEVVFLTPEGDLIGEPQQVAYGSTAVLPEAPARRGSVFCHWSDTIAVQNVTRDLEIKAVYDTITFKVVFLDHKDSVYYEGDFKFEADMSVAKSLERPASAAYTYEFKYWASVENLQDTLGVLTSDMTVKALYDSTLNTFEVVYKDYDGSVIGEAQKVGYGLSAVPPTAPVRDGYDFAGWTDNGDSVVKDMVIYAQYNTASSSSSVPEEPASSSSSYEVVENMIADMNLEQSGSAVRMSYKVVIADPSLKTSVLLVMSNENGLLVDSVMVDSLESESYEGVWEMVQVPAGKYTVELVAQNDSIVDRDSADFEVAAEIKVATGSWNMISIAAMDKSSMDMDRDASFYWWDETNPIGDYWQYRAYNGEEASATRGFWYGTADGRPVVLNNASGDVDSEIVWEMDSLYSGWNMVANPYGWSVDLSQGESDNGAKVEFWRWNSETSEYEMSKVIAPYEAVWAKVTKATTWRMPSAPVYAKADSKVSAVEKVSALRKSAARKASAANWTLLATLADENGKKDSWNVLGAGSMAETMEKAPMGMGEFVRMTIADGKKKLAKSVKTAADEYEWTLNVSANSFRNGKISFEGVAELNKLGYRLYVTDNGKTVELAEGESLPVALAKTTRQLNICVAKSAVVASANRLEGLRMVQAAGTLQMQVDVVGNLAGASAQYALVDVMGKVMAKGNFTANVGTNSFAMQAPKSGLYYLQVKVGSQSLNRRVTIK